jgi:hypothetical protein
MRFRPTVSPPENGCADWASVGHCGGTVRVYVGSFSSGTIRALTVSFRVEGIEKGCFCGGMLGGSGGNRVGVGRTFRGRSRSGSSVFRNVVYTFCRSDMSSKGKSRLTS